MVRWVGWLLLIRIWYILNMSEVNFDEIMKYGTLVRWAFGLSLEIAPSIDFKLLLSSINLGDFILHAFSLKIDNCGLHEHDCQSSVIFACLHTLDFFIQCLEFEKASGRQDSREDANFFIESRLNDITKEANVRLFPHYYYLSVFNRILVTRIFILQLDPCFDRLYLLLAVSRLLCLFLN